MQHFHQLPTGELEHCNAEDGKCAVAEDEAHFITVGDARASARDYSEKKQAFSRRKVVKVTRAQVMAARLKVACDVKLERTPEAAVLKIASVKLGRLDDWAPPAPAKSRWRLRRS